MKTKLYDIVKKILQEFPITRSSDRQLMWYVWEQQGVVKNGKITVDNFVFDAITPESITRCRRKIQEHNPELAGTKDITKKRQLKSLEKGTFIFREGFKTTEQMKL